MKSALLLGGGEKIIADIITLNGYREFVYKQYFLGYLDLIAINQHWLKLKWKVLLPSFLIFLDDKSQLSSKSPLYHALSYGIPTVSIRKGQADHIVRRIHRHKITDAGQLAVHWCLNHYDGYLYMCGFDLRGSDPEVVERWQKFIDHIGPEKAARLKPVSGPLRDMLSKRGQDERKKRRIV